MKKQKEQTMEKKNSAASTLRRRVTPRSLFSHRTIDLEFFHFIFFWADESFALIPSTPL